MPRRGRTPALDFRRIARGMAQQGNDLRHWVSYATVATSDGVTGTMDPTDPNAVLVTPAGVEVDVVLEPSGYPCTARYGVAAGSVHINTPIRPGDQVVVGVPDGDASMIPQVFCIISGSSDPMPTGDDGLPIFRNDRFMVHADVPIELRTADDTMVRITDQLVELGAQGVTEQAVLGTTYTGDEGSMLSSLLTAIVPAAAACHAATNPATTQAAVQALATMLDAFITAINTFQGQAGSHLSPVVKLK